MQAALDKVKNSTAKAKQTQDVGQAGKVKPKDGAQTQDLERTAKSSPKPNGKEPSTQDTVSQAQVPQNKPQAPDAPEDKPSAQSTGSGGPGVGQVGNGKSKPSMQDATAGRVPPAPPKVPTSGNGQDTSPTNAEAGKSPQTPDAQGGAAQKTTMGGGLGEIAKKVKERAREARAAKAKELQAQAAAAKSKAVGRGNQLYKLFHANEQNTAAGQAHNRGYAKLKSGDANAAQITPDNPNFEAAGNAAIQDYNAASEAFGEGLAMCGQPQLASKPPADGGGTEATAVKPPKATGTKGKPVPQGTGEAPPVPAKDGGGAKRDDGNSTTTTYKTSSDGQTREAEVNKTTVADGSVTQSRQRDTQQIGPGGIIETSSSKTSTAGKDGVKVEKDDKVEVIDAFGKRSAEKKTTVKAGKDGVSTSDSVEVDNPDGSRDTMSKDVEIGAKDGSNVVTKKSSRTHVDAAGNSATLKTTHTTVTDKDGKVSVSNSMAVEKKSAQEAAAEKKKAEEEKKKAEEAKQQREAEAKSMKAQAAAAKAQAVGRGNRLYQLFHADESRKGAGQAHNRGMAKLASGDANAARIKPDVDDFVGAGQTAIDDYQAASQAFDEGIAMCGQAVTPVQIVPASGGM
jgi:hypothetical protein